MRYFYSLVLLFSFAVFLNAQEDFQRTAVIPAPEIGGFGNLVSGLDLDDDGNLEIYAVSNNVIDRPEELIPRIFKFEWNPATSQWDSVWGAVLDIPLQNTWPALTHADLDKDGKGEIIWGPVNFLDATLNPNPPRIVVFEAVGDGSDNMGVETFGNFLPNAKFTIVTEENMNVRPIKFVISDIDDDGTDEIIYSDRAGTTKYGVISVSNIPDDGNGSETWTVESIGTNDPVLASTGNIWDLAVVGGTIVLIAQNGLVYYVEYDNGTYTSSGPQYGIMNQETAGSSFKSAEPVDFNADGEIDGIFVAEWFGPRVWLLAPAEQGDSVISIQIGEVTNNARLNGGDIGDVDGDGFVDFVFGSRSVADSFVNNAVYRLSYKGGDYRSADNYEVTMIDSFFFQVGGDVDAISVGQLDGDAAMEVTYTSGYTRRSAEDSAMAIVVLDVEFTPVSVEAVQDVTPQEYFLSNNYPNPFNPTTSFRFGVPNESVVDLRIYDILGNEVMAVINNQNMAAGSYDVTIDASKLASGTYIYRLNAGNTQLTKKMVLMK